MDALLTSLPQTFEGPDWLVERRSAAAAALRERGLPGKKTESWRFTPVRALGSFDGSSRADRRPTIVGERLPDGVRVRSIAETLAKEPALLAPYLSGSADAHFAALNTAMFDDGVWIHVERGVDVAESLALDFGAGEGGQVSYPRVLVTLGEGASLHLVESFDGATVAKGPANNGAAKDGAEAATGGQHLTNAVCEVRLSRNSRLDHIRLHQDSGLLVSRVEVSQEADSRYQSTVVTLGGGLLRLDLHVLLNGSGAECDLRGAYLTDGKNHVDHHTMVEHVATHGTSRQNYRGIVNGESTAVFDGIVVVHRDACQTEAHQENRNLLLSDNATVHTKPHLEIDTDDVICSHGATVGALDQSQLFYLRSRGVSEEAARALLTHAFISEVVNTISDETIREQVSQKVLARIPHGEVIEDMQ